MGSGNNRAEWPPSYSPAAAKNTTPNSTQSMVIPGPGLVPSEDIGIVASGPNDNSGLHAGVNICGQKG